MKKVIGFVIALLLSASPGHAQLRDVEERAAKADDGTSYTITQGIVRVPELRTGSKPGGTIDLAVVRIRRAGSTSKSVHFVLAGGPGDSGVTLVTGLARQGGATLFDLFDGDLVGIDQRGTGKSSPNLESRALYGLPVDRPGSPEDWLPFIERASRNAVADLAARGIHLEAYNTQESADDIDDVRKAFDYDRITLWGRSYGSHLALATLRRHEARVQRVVLVSPEGPNDTLKLPSRVDAALQRLSSRVAQDPKTGSRVPDLTALIRRVLDRLAEKPVTVEIPHPVTRESVRVGIGRFDVQWITAGALGDPRTAATIPIAFLEMDSGDFRRIAQTLLMRRSLMGIESAMKHMMDLSSGSTAERRARITNEAREAVLGNAINFPLFLLDDAWGRPDLGDDFRRSVSSKVPVLILVGDLDPRTPVENGVEIAGHLPASHLVVLENASHQFDLFGSLPIRAVLGQFLRGEPIPVTRITLLPLKFD